MSQHPEETAGLDLFDETASAAGSFPHAMLGYERQAVDAYVRDVERELSTTKRKLRSVQKQLTEANLRVDDTDYSKLGVHTGELLRNAEAQASELIKDAEDKAAKLLAEAQDQADQTIATANESADTARTAAIADLRQLREDLSNQTANEIDGAKGQAEGLRQAADQHRTMVMAEAERNAVALAEGARLEADQIKQVAEREAAETLLAAQQEAAQTRVAVAQEREQALTDLKAKQDEVQATMATLLATSKQQSEDYGAKIEADAVAMDQRRQLTFAEADQHKIQAAEEVRGLLAKAKEEAERLISTAENEAKTRQVQLRRETERLMNRKQAIMAQLNSLSALANRSVDDYPNAPDEQPSDEQSQPESDSAANEPAHSAETPGDAQAETAAEAPAEAPTEAGEPEPATDDDATRIQGAVTSDAQEQR